MKRWLRATAHLALGSASAAVAIAFQHHGYVSGALFFGFFSLCCSVAAFPPNRR